MEKREQVKLVAVGLVYVVVLAVVLQALTGSAQDCGSTDCGIAIGGVDRSGQLSSLTSIAKTVQVMSIKYAAPVIGGILVFFGIYKIAMREAVVGAIAVLGGGGLLFLPKIITQLSGFVA